MTDLTELQQAQCMLSCGDAAAYAVDDDMARCQNVLGASSGEYSMIRLYPSIAKRWIFDLIPQMTKSNPFLRGIV